MFLLTNGLEQKMSQYHADNIIDLALELFGDDYTDAQLAEAEAVYFNNLPDGPY